MHNVDDKEKLRIQLIIPKELYIAIDEYGKRYGLSKRALIQKVMTEYLEGKGVKF